MIDFTHSDFVVANPSVPRFISISPDDFSLDEYILKDRYKIIQNTWVFARKRASREGEACHQLLEVRRRLP